MPTIPVNDLSRHNAPLLEQLENATRAVLAGGWYILGPQVRSFEEEFARYCGVPYAVGLGNGTDALEIALRAVGVQPGDRVATVANAGGYSTTAILAAGAEPAYVEIDPCTMLMHPDALADARSRVRAVVVTHLYGRMADMPALLGAAGGLPVIEDCAQAHGARLAGVHAGAWGAAGCFSFYPTKNLGALGDGGAVITCNPDLAARIRALRQYGWSAKYRSSQYGRNSRLDEVQAAVLRVKLPYLDGWNGRRRDIARLYRVLLQDRPLELPPPPESDDVVHLYVIRTAHRDRLRERLATAGIATDIHYPVVDYQQDAARGRPWAAVSLHKTERCASEILTLPCFPELTDGEIREVAQAVHGG